MSIDECLDELLKRICSSSKVGKLVTYDFIKQLVLDCVKRKFLALTHALREQILKCGHFFSIDKLKELMMLISDLEIIIERGDVRDVNKPLERIYSLITNNEYAFHSDFENIISKASKLRTFTQKLLFNGNFIEYLTRLFIEKHKNRSIWIVDERRGVYLISQHSPEPKIKEILRYVREKEGKITREDLILTGLTRTSEEAEIYLNILESAGMAWRLGNITDGVTYWIFPAFREVRERKKR